MPRETIAGVAIPDSALARELTELVRDSEPALLFHHSRRVFLFGSLTARARDLKYDPELLYAGAMFHDVGLTERYHGSLLRFEVDSANAARDFLHGHGIRESDVEAVWTAIALHTTPGIPEHMRAEIALVTTGVEMDVLGIGYERVTDDQRAAVVEAHPRGDDFKHRVIDAFYHGMKHRPDSTFGTVNDDVLAHFDPHFERTNFCTIILDSRWSS